MEERMAFGAHVHMYLLPVHTLMDRRKNLDRRLVTVRSMGFRLRSWRLRHRLGVSQSLPTTIYAESIRLEPVRVREQ
jgi:hypothetical protein